MDNTSIKINEKKFDYEPHTHLYDYLAIVLKYKWIVLCCFLFIVGSVTIASLLSTPMYQATSQIMIREQPSLINPLGENRTRGFSQNEYFQTQVNLLSNRSLVWEVITSLNLQDIIEQDVAGEDDSTHAMELSLKGSAVASEVKALPDDPTEKEIAAKTNPALIDWYLSHLSVSPLQESSLVDIHFNGTDPELITRIVNAHTQAAIHRIVRLQKAHAHDVLDWLKNQIDDQKDEVQTAQKKIHSYKKQNDLLTVEDRQNLISLELDQINSSLIEARNIRIAKKAAYDQLGMVEDGRVELMVLPEIINDSVLLNLRNRLVEINARKIEMATKYGPKHPKMIQLNLGINQLKMEIATEIRRLKKAIQADLNRARTIESNLQKSLEEKKQIAMDLGKKNIQYDVLKRQADSSDEIYDFLLKQSQEISLSSVMDTSGVQIVDRAEVPIKPVKPNHKLNIAMAILLGFLFSAGLAFFLEYMDNTVKEPLDISMQLGMPVLGMIPYDKNQKYRAQLAIPWKENATLTEQPVSLAARYPISNRFPVLFRPNDPGASGRVVMIESATMEEGKTTITLKAASSMAAAGLRVLLVDGDLIRPTLSRTVGFSNGKGLTAFLKKIMNYHVDRGDLSVCSLDDLFFLIGLKRRNGNLIVKNVDDQIMEVFFQDGHMVHLQFPNNRDANRLGTMLINSGLITEEQLQDALDRNKRTGQPLGYILVNSGYLTRDKLQGPLRLQMEENLQKLFSWKTGQYKFESGAVNIFKRERIAFTEEYSEIIRMLGKVEGSRLVEEEIFSQIKRGYGENLYILPAGSRAGGMQPQLNHLLMQKVFDVLRQRFDVILIDTSPLEAQSDTLTLSSLADDIIFVIKAGKLSHKALNQAKSTIPQEKIIGAILNQVKVKESSYYNYY